SGPIGGMSRDNTPRCRGAVRVLGRRGSWLRGCVTAPAAAADPPAAGRPCLWPCPSHDRGALVTGQRELNRHHRVSLPELGLSQEAGQTSLSDLAEACGTFDAIALLDFAGLREEVLAHV